MKHQAGVVFSVVLCAVALVAVAVMLFLDYRSTQAEEDRIEQQFTDAIEADGGG